MSSARETWNGRQLGKYRLLGRLGEGGMGVVWEAEDVTLGRRIALKLLAPTVAVDAEALARFHQEARAAASLNHPHVVQVHEVDQFDGTPFLVMELMAGGSVSRLLRSGPLPWREATRLIADACRGLVAAHAAGLLHRDIKPGNILLTPDGVAKLADFGIARFSTQITSLTPTGNVVGTPDYMSPEQCRSETLDVRSDVYSLAATYFALLTGRSPFPADTPLQSMFAHCSSPIPNPGDFIPTIPRRCSVLIARALAKTRSDRHPSAAALLSELEDALSAPDGELTAAAGLEHALAPTHRLGRIRPGDPSALKRRRLLLLGGGMLLAAGTGVGWHLLGRTPQDNKEEPSPPPRIPSPIQLRPRFRLEPKHRVDVQSLAVSPDERLLASGDADGVIHLWQLPEGKYLRTLIGHTSRVFALAFSRDGKTLVSGGDDRTLRRWDPDTGSDRGDPGEVTSVLYDLSFSPDGTLLAAARAYSGVILWQYSPSGRLKVLYEKPVKGLLVRATFSPDGSRLALLDHDHQLELREPGSSRLIARLPDLKGFRWLAFGPEGQVALGSSMGKVLLWRPPDNDVTLLTDQKETITCLAWTPDGGSLIYGGVTFKGLHVCHVPTRDHEDYLLRRNGAAALSLAFAAGGRTLISGHARQAAVGAIQLWDVEELSP